MLNESHVTTCFGINYSLFHLWRRMNDQPLLPPISMLTILIPTYNRAVYLKKNLLQLCSFVSHSGLTEEVAILVSNNLSPDDTIESVSQVQNTYPNVNLKLVNQSQNIGSVRNVLFLLGAADTEYVLYTGDDDYLEEGFLLKVVSLVREGQVTLAVPSNMAVSLEGEPL